MVIYLKNVLILQTPKLADDMGMIVFITDKGRVKLSTIINSQSEK